MKVPYPGAIDCDLHPAMPGMAALLPYGHSEQQLLQFR
jgi:hypothetical protein